ncbi:MAG: DUF1638 domain-containing protein [Planctomycetota bacterium]
MSEQRIHVIACAVLGGEVRAVAERLGLDVTTTFLPGGLHERPGELRRELQKAIDDASTDGTCERIAIGYGLCGMGTSGIVARSVPLAIPRIQDCIALLLGSDAAYRKQFRTFPGTYYVSPGWVEEKTQPASAPDDGARRDADEAKLAELVEKYGRQNAEAIRYFLDSWKRNYQRAAYIDTPAGGDRRRYAAIARAMAEEFGWRYEHLSGTDALLRAVLTARESNDEVLVVPPGARTRYDAVARGLTAGPDNAEPAGEGGDTLLVFETDDEPGEEAASSRRRGPSRGVGGGSHIRWGLGIDAGGTYTDAVVYDFDRRRVADKAKALTTPWDYTEGISAVLDSLDAGLLKRVELVALSTTLATNAIVEGRGQKVGLLVMPPYGLFDPADIAHRPIAVLDARMEIDGTQTEPVRPEQVRRVARDMIERKGVGAFAVTGYASYVNPANELEVRRILREQTHLSVTCGHEVSDEVNYRVRAATSALNARIIPALESLLDRAGAALDARGIDAPVMVVKSDGSLMNVATARQRPIETILSGPAASVAGAAHLSGLRDAVVVDVGGTTTDTAALEGGVVRTCARGASVGGWRTHVKALDMRTLALGGDSAVAWVDRRLHIGPRRVAPLAWLGATPDGPAAALSSVEQTLEQFVTSTRGMDILAATGRQPPFEPADGERGILEHLQRRPHAVAELAEALGSVAWQFLPTARLEDAHVVQRCGLTPTDLLHATGAVSLWDAATARRGAEMVARVMGIELDELADRVMQQAVRMLAVELLAGQVAGDGAEQEAETLSPDGAIVANWLAGGSQRYRVRVSLSRPIVGIGAPARFFLPPAGERMDTEVVIPPDAEVANAVGAVTSSVSVRRQVSIAPTESGRYAIEGIAGAPTFRRLTAAHEHAVDALRRRIVRDARRAGTSARRVEIAVYDRIASAADGTEIFLGRTLSGRLTGRPDLARSS